ncbi:hypothetical protein ACW9HQ_49810, partial [Nocardia gipuzkoensis]
VVNIAGASGEVSVERLSDQGGIQGLRRVELVTYGNGDQYIRKTLMNARLADAEVLSGAVAHAFGVPMPRTFADGNVVYTERVTDRFDGQVNPPPGGRITGGVALHELLTNHRAGGDDRVVTGPDGKLRWANYHRSYETAALTPEVVNRHTERFVRVGKDGTVEVIDHDLTRSEVGWVRRTVEALRP